MGARPTPALEALQVAQAEASKAIEAHRAAEQQRADAERALGVVRAELLQADANDPAFAALVQKRTLHEARLETLTARLQSAADAAQKAAAAVNGAAVPVQREQLAALEKRAHELEAGIRQRARAFATEESKQIEELHTLMLDGAQLIGAIGRATTGQSHQGPFLAFTDTAGFTDNVLRQHFANLKNELDGHDLRVAAARRT